MAKLTNVVFKQSSCIFISIHASHENQMHANKDYYRL